MHRKRSHLELLWALGLVVGACAGDNSPPSLVFIEDQLVTVGERMQVGLEATDVDGDSIDFLVEGLPPTAELALTGSTSALLLWTPGPGDAIAGGRVYPIEVTALDGRGGAARQALTITAQPGQGVPEIDLPVGMTLNLMERDHLTLTVNVRDHDSAEVELVMTESPPGGQFLKSGPKEGLLHWKPQGEQLLTLVHRFTIVATDDVHAPVSHTMMVVLLGASDAAGCPGTSPTIAHVPLMDQAVDSLSGGVAVEVEATDAESSVATVALYWSEGDPQKTGTQRLDLQPIEGADGQFGGILDVGEPSAEGTLIHYSFEIIDNDDPTAGSCDHVTHNPKEGAHRVGLYPPNSDPTLCVDDTREPDDTLGGASSSEPGVLLGRLCGAGEDHVAVEVPGGSTLTARLSHAPSHGSLDLLILDSSGAELDLATVNQGNLVVHHTTAATETLYLRVRSGDSDSRLSYALEIAVDAADCEHDALEPNDTAAEASLVGGGLTTDLEICPGDSDWHRISVGAASRVEVTLRSEPGFGDLDLVLTDLWAEEILASSLTYDPTERLVWTTDSAVDLLIHAYGFLGGINAYELEVEITALSELCTEDVLGVHATSSQSVSLFGHTVYDQLQACPGAPDWFAVDVNGGESLQVLVTDDAMNGDLALTLYEEGSQAPVATAVSEDGLLEVAWSLPWAGRLTWVVESASSVPYAMIYGLDDGAGPCAFDRLEPNDSDATASSVEPGVFTWLRLCPDDPVDTFAIEVEPFEFITVTTSHLPGMGYADIEIVDPAGQVIDSALDPYAGLSMETLSVSAGTYLVRVLPYAVEERLSYDLAIGVN